MTFLEDILMRDSQIKTQVTTLITKTFTGANADVATVILDPDDSGFGPLCSQLREEGHGDSEQITALWKKVATHLDENDKLDAIVDGFFDSPCVYLSSLVGQV